VKRVLFVGLLFIMLAFIGVLVASNDAIAQQPTEHNIDRPGLDYDNFDMRVNNPDLCKQACFADIKCKAWTFVKPNTTQGPKPRCWLKTEVPQQVNNTCCDSGIIKVQSPPDGDGPNGCDPPVCCHKPSLPQCNP
jgi:hypothetical protein